MSSFSKSLKSIGMKEDTRRRLSELVLEELSEKIKKHEGLRKKLEAFTDLPVEKVADAILNQFEYLLSSDLRDLIIYLIEQEVTTAGESPAQSAVVSPPQPAPPPPPPARPVEEARPKPAEKPAEMRKPAPEVRKPAAEVRKPAPAEPSRPAQPAAPGGSVMEHFAAKELFPTAPLDFALGESDWFCLYGVSYAPDSTGKGMPTRKLLQKGVDGLNDLFFLDYGDVRFYLSKLTAGDYTLDKSGRPVIPLQKASRFKYEHERVLNFLRSEDVLMPLPFWTLLKGREKIISRIEDQYVELLRVLIDVHDAVEWDVEVFAFDQHIVTLPGIAEGAKERSPQRDLKHPVREGKDIKQLERLMMKEKSIASDIHSSLLLHSTKAKVDYMVRLDNAFMDDWKSILAARYTVGKDKRKTFWQEIRSIQQQYADFEFMIRVTNPNTRLSFTP